MTKKQWIVDLIGRTGPWPFERYMEQVLYHPELGYFSTGPIRSRTEGDFVTSPEVSPAFGTTLARLVEKEYERIGADRFTVVEVGAGSGSLLAPLLDRLSFRPRVIATERSVAARRHLQEKVPQAEVVWAEQEPLRFQGVIIANEVIDNFPVALAFRKGGVWREWWVDVKNGGLVFSVASVRPLVEKWLDSYAGEMREGALVEVQLDAQNWIWNMAAQLEAGCLVIFDYGGCSEYLAERGVQGTLRTYRQHRPGTDVFAAPGKSDITASVNFSALQDTAEEAGLVCELVTQKEFLTRWGLEDYRVELQQQERDAAVAGDTMRQYQAGHDRLGVEALLNPTGLGRFQVLTAHR